MFGCVTVDVVPAAPVSAWAVKLIVLTEPPEAVALKPETKFRAAVNEPLRTLSPLNEAPLTASVSCWPSEASVVLMLLMSAPGWAASVSAVWIEPIVVTTELSADEAVSRTDWLCVRAEFAAVTTPLSELSWVAIDQ
jgi:hypothetical protein